MATKAGMSANACNEAQKAPSASPEFVPAPVLFTIPQAAAYLGAKVSAIRNLIWDEDLRVVPIGQRYMIRREDLDAWVRANSLLASDLHAWEKARTAKRAPRRAKPGIGANRGKVRGKRGEVVSQV